MVGVRADGAALAPAAGVLAKNPKPRRDACFFPVDAAAAAKFFVPAFLNTTPDGVWKVSPPFNRNGNTRVASGSSVSVSATIGLATAFGATFPLGDRRTGESAALGRSGDKGAAGLTAGDAAALAAGDFAFGVAAFAAGDLAWEGVEALTTGDLTGVVALAGVVFALTGVVFAFLAESVSQHAAAAARFPGVASAFAEGEERTFFCDAPGGLSLRTPDASSFFDLVSFSVFP